MRFRRTAPANRRMPLQALLFFVRAAAGWVNLNGVNLESQLNWLQPGLFSYRVPRGSQSLHLFAAQGYLQSRNGLRELFGTAARDDGENGGTALPHPGNDHLVRRIAGFLRDSPQRF